MGKHFTKIRRRTRLSALLTALLFGVGVGALTVSALVLVLKLLGIAMQTWYWFSGVAGFALATGISYLIFMPSDRRLAKRLDEEHGLDEKMRTMVAFRDSDDAFMKLQREDADERLGQIKVVTWRRRQLIAALLVVVLSFGSVTGAILVPQKEAASGPTEAPIDADEKSRILAELAKLIQMVEEMELIAPALKENSLTELKSLVAFVEAHDYLSEMKSEAIGTVLRITFSLAQTNTALTVGKNLSQSATEEIQELGKVLAELSGSKSKSALEDLRKSLKNAELDQADFAADELLAATRQDGLDASDPFVRSLNKIAASLKSYAGEELELEDAFAPISELVYEINIQNVNQRSMQVVISRLCALFGITPEDLAGLEGGENVDTRPPSDHEDQDEELPPEFEEPDDTIGSGGMGTGDRIYGSNDEIYYPDDNKYDKYHALANSSHAAALEMLNDGKIPEEFRAFIDEYFRILNTPVEE